MEVQPEGLGVAEVCEVGEHCVKCVLDEIRPVDVHAGRQVGRQEEAEGVGVLAPRQALPSGYFRQFEFNNVGLLPAFVGLSVSSVLAVTVVLSPHDFLESKQPEVDEVVDGAVLEALDVDSSFNHLACEVDSVLESKENPCIGVFIEVRLSHKCLMKVNYIAVIDIHTNLLNIRSMRTSFRL